MHSIDILYEDNHLLVLNKPAGLLTQPSGVQQDSLERQAKAWIKDTYQKPGEVFLEAIHRLDKPVSGIVVFGRTSKALSRLNASIRDKKTEKYYYALVEGHLPAKKGVLENYMIHDEFKAIIVDDRHASAKIARLDYTVISETDRFSLVEIRLDTGRYHQIRLQLSHIGCPILGDTKYHSQTVLKEEGIALHHFRFSIPHPVKPDLMVFETPIPTYFQKYLN